MMIVLVVIVFAIIILALIWRFRSGADVTIGPDGLRAKGQNREGAVIERSKSRVGSARAHDHTGTGARISETEVERDLDAYSGPANRPKG
jgi:hypothetical protein